MSRQTTSIQLNVVGGINVLQGGGVIKTSATGAKNLSSWTMTPFGYISKGDIIFYYSRHIQIKNNGEIVSVSRGSN